jgi:hypothetical protein
MNILDGQDGSQSVASRIIDVDCGNNDDDDEMTRKVLICFCIS